MNTAFTDAEMIAAIKEGGRSLDKVLNYIYHQSGFRESIVNYVIKYKGSREDAEDIFQDGLSRMVMNIKKGKFQEETSDRSEV